MHWGRLLACPNEWFPAPMGVNLPQWGLTVGGFLPRWRGWSREGAAVGLAAGRPGHSARLVGPLIRRGWSARSLGTEPLVAAAGAPMAGPASPPPHPAHPGRGMRRRWSASGTWNAQCPSVRIRVPQWNRLAREHLNPGVARQWTVFTAIPTRQVPLSQRCLRIHVDATLRKRYNACEVAVSL